MFCADGGQSLDEEVLRIAAQRLGSLTTIESVAVFPREKSESVVARFDLLYYPGELRQVELELRAYTNGDFHVMYREEWDGGDWQCRWDRHDNPHNSRDHFHQPPAARTEDAVDRDFPPDLFSLLPVVLAVLDERLSEVWEK